MKLRSWIGFLSASAVLFALPVYAQDGGALFNTYCAICHESGGNSQAPSRDAARPHGPEQILDALEKGAMKGRPPSAAARSGTHLPSTFRKPPGMRRRSFPRRHLCANTGSTFRAWLTGRAGTVGAPGP
jgi:hypothetical protein